MALIQVSEILSFTQNNYRPTKWDDPPSKALKTIRTPKARHLDGSIGSIGLKWCVAGID